jgi:hypothetical protein
MENEKAARFFIGTLLEETVESVEVKPQEFTYTDKLAGLSVFRLDFVATVKTETGGRKKVLIEIQKAKNPVDLMRFRNYLAEQYKKEDEVDGVPSALPITTIYVLGFKLPEINSPCIRVSRGYIDLITKSALPAKSDFVEKLTHDSYVVQVGRITDRYQTRLDKLLSVFEQNNFTDDKGITKDYRHSPDLEEVRSITEILHYVGTDPQERKQIEIEQEAWRSVNAMFEAKERKYRQELEDQRKALSEKDKLIEELMRKLNERR